MSRFINNSCYLCGSKDLKIRHSHTRDNPDIDVMKCSSCGLVFLSSFSHIKENFYESSGMHEDAIDIDLWLKETECDDERRYQWVKPLLENKTLLDFGCGTGGFLLKAKGSAERIMGVEPEQRLISHFEGNSLDVFADLDELEMSGETFDIITMFHVLEHIPDPVMTLKRLSDRLSDGGQLIVEVPSADDALLTLYNSEPFADFTYWSCHLYLFNPSTISKVAEKADLKVNYVKQIQRYSLANHLCWLSKGKPGGHKDWHFIDSDELSKTYENQLASIGSCDTLIASLSEY